MRLRLRCVNPVAADVSPLIIPAGEKFEPTHVGCYDEIDERPACQSGSLSGRPQTSRRRLAITHRHGRNINANPTRGFSRGRWTILRLREEAFLAIFAHHHGFKGIYVRATNLIFLFYLDGIPAFFQAQFAFLLLGVRPATSNPP